MPSKMYEWGIFPDRTERRKTSMICSCPIISANGTSTVLNTGKHLCRYGFGNLINCAAGTYGQETVRFGGGQLQVAISDPLVKRNVFQFKTFLARTVCGLDATFGACQATGGIAVDQDGQVGS